VIFHGGQAAQHISQVFLWIDAAATATLNDGVDDRAAPAGVGMADEQPSLSTHHRWPHIVFHDVIVYLKATVVKISALAATDAVSATAVDPAAQSPRTLTE
jgi:hypothetical protein